MTDMGGRTDPDTAKSPDSASGPATQDAPQGEPSGGAATTLSGLNGSNAVKRRVTFQLFLIIFCTGFLILMAASGSGLLTATPTVLAALALAISIVCTGLAHPILSKWIMGSSTGIKSPEVAGPLPGAMDTATADEHAVVDPSVNLTDVQRALKRDMLRDAQAESAPVSGGERLARHRGPKILVSTGNFLIQETDQEAAPLVAALGATTGAPLPGEWDRLARDVAAGGIAGEVELTAGDDTFDIHFEHLADAGVVALIGRNVTEQRAAEERIRQLANIDMLTGLPNRALFNDRLEQVLRQAKRSGAAAAVHLIDVDHFKDVNDSLGHTQGDQMLREIGERLAHCVRDSDTVARLGGDEFAIIQVGGTDANGASVLAQKVLDIFNKPFIMGGEEIHSDASIGVTLFPEEAVSTEQILRNADMALYRAKGEGRGTYRFFIADMNEEVQRLKEIEADMRKALEVEGQFQLYYQPKLNLHSGRVGGMEALIRWIHPEKGFLSPGDFIPVAEKSKLIVPIDTWSLRTACRQTKAWADMGVSDLKVAVNLSAVQFREKGLVDLVASILEETGLPAHQLELEITEGVAMDDPESAIRTFHAIRALGVSLSIDDFGTGYSSLSYLKNFPVRRVKIDKAFVDDIETGQAEEGAIAKAVTTLGHSFDMEVTAEGVETEEQLTFLRGLGVDEIQGYYFSKPIPAPDFARFVGSFNDEADRPGE
ncbi:MAG: putative bifunctional diguanylate cyclase/phosphodiesterase [Magnetovibrionaceae bacterium]